MRCMRQLRSTTVLIIALAGSSIVGCASTLEMVFNPPLIKAAGAGDSARVRELLADGVFPVS